MAGLHDKQADDYYEARPRYPSDWYSKLSALTPHHNLAWDVGTGNGQAAIGVAEHYAKVIATDSSEAQIKRAISHPKVQYIHTPDSITDKDLISLIGAEGSVDLITVATAVHWFDLPKFYSIATHLLRKPGGVIALWAYSFTSVNDEIDAVTRRFEETVRPYWNEKTQYCFDQYKTLPFPFESVGLGSEGEPAFFYMHKEFSFDGYLRMLKSWSAVTTAKEVGVDLLHDRMVEELNSAWGGKNLMHTVTYKCFTLVGRPRVQSS
ncbi:uncharacterized protein [Aristolochia californica]|uniref:uncharacterized protein n=1 Tax=Aristolochia californica TaxID=171875 RepID=UPI0035DED38A